MTGAWRNVAGILAIIVGFVLINRGFGARGFGSVVLWMGALICETLGFFLIQY